MRLAPISAALFAAGALAGTLTDPGRHGAPARIGDYWVMAADLHVHGFFGDGALPPWEIRAEARRRGLDAVALSNHNQRMAGRIDRTLFGTRSDPIVLGAEEITSRHYHLIGIGITDTVDWDQSAAGAIAAVHAQAGAAIAAHPAHAFWEGFDAEALARLDGAEIAHPMIDGNDEARADLVEFSRAARARNPHLAPIGSTDFHFRAPMGLCRTYVFARDLTEAAVVEAVRSGRTVAYDSARRANGDPALVAIAERARKDRGEGGRRLLETLSVAAALVGLLGLIVLR